MKKKRFKHKWWEHLLFKYKVVETETCYREYERCRNWFIIACIILAVIFSPIVVIVFLVASGIFEEFYFKDGKRNGYEEYTIHNKEDLEIKKECEEYES